MQHRQRVKRSEITLENTHPHPRVHRGVQCVDPFGNSELGPLPFGALCMRAGREYPCAVGLECAYPSSSATQRLCIQASLASAVTSLDDPSLLFVSSLSPAAPAGRRVVEQPEFFSRIFCSQNYECLSNNCAWRAGKHKETKRRVKDGRVIKHAQHT
jgi:hypothetical protein